MPVLMPNFFGRAIGGNDDAVPAPAAAHPDRAALQLGIQGDFATGEEAVAIHVQDAVGRFRIHGQTLIEPKFRPSRVKSSHVGRDKSCPKNGAEKFPRRA
jgi:hypothetical protein